MIIDLEAEDPEDNPLTYSFEITDATTSLIDNQLTVTPSQDFNGSLDLTVTVSDGLLEDTETLSIEVLPINDAPSFITLEIGDANENEEYSQIIEYILLNCSNI